MRLCWGHFVHHVTWISVKKWPGNTSYVWTAAPTCSAHALHVKFQLQIPTLLYCLFMWHKEWTSCAIQREKKDDSVACQTKWAKNFWNNWNLSFISLFFSQERNSLFNMYECKSTSGWHMSCVYTEGVNWWARSYSHSLCERDTWPHADQTNWEQCLTYRIFRWTEPPKRIVEFGLRSSVTWQDVTSFHSFPFVKVHRQYSIQLIEMIPCFIRCLLLGYWRRLEVLKTTI